MLSSAARCPDKARKKCVRRRKLRASLAIRQLTRNMRPPSSGSRLTCEGRTARCGDTLLTDCALKYIKQHDSRTKTNIPRNRHRRRQAETHVRGHLNHFGRNFKFTIKPTFCNRTEPEPSQSACVNKQLQKKAKLKDKDKGVMIDGFSARCIST